VCTLG